jgi:predicted RNA-binding protein with RPS1 domain
MDLSPEVLASIVSVDGKWSLSIATTPHSREHPHAKANLQLGEITRDLETHFNWAFSCLQKYLRNYPPNLK